MQTFVDSLPMAKEKILDNIKQTEVALVSDSILSVSDSVSGCMHAMPVKLVIVSA